MKVALWAEIRRLHEIERLSQRAIAKRLHCCHTTVAKALAMTDPPSENRRHRASRLDPYRAQIDELIAKYPDLSAVRVREEIAKGPDGYRGGITLVRHYLHHKRPDRRRVYQEVHYEPAEAMQVDWGDCGRVQIAETSRRLSVFVAVLCYSRLCYIEFALSQRKAEFYRAIVNSLSFFGGTPRRLIVDNLKAAVLERSAGQVHFHPEFLALCGHFCIEPVACAPRDPESKGISEATVRYVKHNALQGRDEQLRTWDDYLRFAPLWRDSVANVRIHHATRERPLDRFAKEHCLLRPIPDTPFSTDELLSAVVTPYARVCFDSNRYSVPPQFARKQVTLRASTNELRVIYHAQEIARHRRCYQKRRVICLAEHQLQAIKMRKRSQAKQLEIQFHALGPDAVRFHEKLLTVPVKPIVHLRRLLGLVQLYGRCEVLSAMATALEYQTYDSAYVESIMLQQRRRRELPSPTPLRPQRRELIEEIDIEEPDPARYDQLYCENREGSS